MTSTQDTEPIRMLLVEDDAESGEALRTMLTRRGVDVTLLYGAEAALEQLDPAKHEIIVSDIRLRGMSGVGLLQKVRERLLDFPVILITGFDSLESAIQALRYGAQDYILKPVDTIDELLLPVQKAVHAYRLLLRNRSLEKELRVSEARFRDILEHSMDIAFRIDLGTRSFDYMSPSCEQVLGYEPQYLMSLELDAAIEMVHPEDRPAVREVLTHLREAGSNRVDLPMAECRIRTASDEYRWLAFRGRATGNGEDNLPQALVGNARDITENRRMVEREEALRERLVRAERMESLGVLAGGVAHDLNNLLSPTVALPGVMLMDLAEAPEVFDVAQFQGNLRSLEEAGMQAVAVIRDLLTLGRRGNIQPEPVDLKEVVESYLRSAACREQQSKHPSVRIESQFAAALLRVAGSKPHLSQILMNLIINAMEAMPHGGVLKVNIENVVLEEAVNGYEIVPHGNYVVLRVGDAGTGIEQKHLARIFEPFYTKKKMGQNSGSGLGLSVVYGVIKDHKGYVDMHTQLGVGTEFTVYLPVSDREEICHQTTITYAGGGSDRILVVDDLEQQRKLVGHLLARFGYETTLVAGGRQAVQIFKEYAETQEQGIVSSPFDLVILDMIMEEGFDGLDTFRGIRELLPDQKCILVSGFADTCRVREALKLGANHFVAKPYTAAELGRTVRRALDGQ